MLKSVELFAGAGGLAMGVGLAGFSCEAVVEIDRWACDTIRQNQNRGFPLSADWPVHQGDIKKFDFRVVDEEIDLLSGGPPCQPFSLGGKHRADQDDRDLFPATVDALRQLRPRAFIIENVKGLTRASFANYFQYILLQLSYPEVVRRRDEDPLDHLARLEKIKTSGQRRGLTYEVVHRVLNAADYGVPQKRERVIMVGFRHDLGVKWSFPVETHSLDALLHDQWVTGEYWDRHRVAKSRMPELPSRMERRIERLRTANEDLLNGTRPWRTVRDALVDLPDPRRKTNKVSNHKFQPGARVYPGHTGSPLDMPSKALKAGVHGVPGGENMMVLTDGSVRYLTAREAARIQTFPDDYHFTGAWTEIMRQLGNAVPVRLAHVVASGVARELILSSERELRAAIRRLASK